MKKRILVVGANETFCGMIGFELCLAANGGAFEIIRAASGCEARDKLIEAVIDPDLVVIDFEMLMPGIGGLDLLKIIRNTPSLQQLFVVMVAVQPTPQLQSVAKALNCECFRKFSDLQMLAQLLVRRWSNE